MRLIEWEVKMIVGKITKQEGELDECFLLLAAVVKQAARDSREARRRRVLDVSIQHAEDWLRAFVEGSQFECEILSLAGLVSGDKGKDTRPIPGDRNDVADWSVA